MVWAHRYEYSAGATASVRRIERRDLLEVGGFGSISEDTSALRGYQKGDAGSTSRRKRRLFKATAFVSPAAKHMSTLRPPEAFAAHQQSTHSATTAVADGRVANRFLVFSGLNLGQPRRQFSTIVQHSAERRTKRTSPQLDRADERPSVRVQRKGDLSL